MNAATARALIYSMRRIRSVEEMIAERYSEQQIRCPTHLSIGQEGAAAAVGTALRHSDYAVSGHRAHAHYLAKGGDLRAMIAEIYGKATGCARGKGGSMHLVDESVGFMGSTAIVAGTVPVGVGLGYGLKLGGTDRLSCVFFGDAVVEAGVFFESLNFAVLKKLPVLFICENNLYSVYSPLSVRQPPGRKIHELAAAMGLPSQLCDGNDVQKAHEVTTAAVQAIRDGGGPQFIELSTYRWREHCGPMYDNSIGYRTEAEFLAWKGKDPIARFEDAVLSAGLLNASDIDTLQKGIDDEVKDAFAFAERSPFPPPSDAFTNLYASPTDAIQSGI